MSEESIELSRFKFSEVFTVEFYVEAENYQKAKQVYDKMFDKNIQLGYDTWKNVADKNISADTKLKVEQKLKTISETRLNETMRDLNELKKAKGVTGSAINDLMNNLGLDPTNNDTDKWVVRGMLIAHFGIDNLTKIAKLFPKQIGDIISKGFNLPKG